MKVKAIMTDRFFDLVAPLGQRSLFNAEPTAMRITDTATAVVWSGAVSQLGLFDARPGDVDSATGRSTPATTTMPGARTLPTATRTTTTRTTSAAWFSSADQSRAGHADFSFSDLVQAHDDCRRHKRNKGSTLAFEINLEHNLWQLYEDLKAGTYQPGPSICFVITRPKHREVWAAQFRDRIVHHLLYNQIAPSFHAGFIADSCACIPGRGTLYGALRLEAKIRSLTQNWSRPAHYLKLDLANFFVSIDKHQVLNRLVRRIHQPWWLQLAERILFHDPRAGAIVQATPAMLAKIPPHKSLFNQPAHIGLPIGNLSSQFFANVLLDALDQFIKHQLKARHYIRYVDDMVLLHDDTRWLNAAHQAIAAWLPEQLGLRLNESKTILQPVDRGVDFVGQVIRPWHRTLRRRTYRVAMKRIATSNPESLYKTANSYFGLLRQTSHSHADRARLANLLRQRGYTIAGDLTKTHRKSPSKESRT